MNLRLQDIRDIIVTTLSTLLNDDISIEIEDIQEIPSTQQCVFIVKICENARLNKNSKHDVENNANNANNAISKNKTIVHMPSLMRFRGGNENPLKWALKDGNDRIVLRIWNGGASWWNLNSNCYQTCTKIAKSEVAGYRVARRALLMYTQHCMKVGHFKTEQQIESTSWNPTQVIIPDLLYFSLDNVNERKDIEKTKTPSLVSSFPFAIFSYVGNGSKTIGIGASNIDQENENDNANKSNQKWVFCDSLVRNMVKIRHEFGYGEPHPRHGRVSVELALDYAMQVLDSVILPLHSAFFIDHLSGMMSKKGQNKTHNSSGGSGGRYINSILLEDIYPLSRVYNKGKNYENELTVEPDPSPCRYHDMIALYQKTVLSLKQTAPTKNQHTNVVYSRKLHQLIDILEECVENLISEAKLHYPNLIGHCGVDSEDVIPPVLCHMDLQPQNMIMRQLTASCSTESCSTEVASTPRIASVLDWEESCYADPRFELLMLCRKVVANRIQADILWEYYSNIMGKRFELSNNTFGPIEPWLKLETIHSLFTLIMQGMDLQGGGRNPWEGKHDLWGKVSRELSRLVDLGWSFCQIQIV